MFDLGLLWFSGVPIDTRFDHQVDGVSVLNVVLFKQFGVCESFALHKESLSVRRGRSVVCGGELGLDGGNSISG